MTKPKPKVITESHVRLVAALADADPRTARRYLEGEPVKGEALRERLAKAVVDAKAARKAAQR